VGAIAPVLVDELLSLLSQPHIAVLLGASLGVGLLLFSRASFRGVTAEDPARGIMFAAIGVVLRLALSALLLWAYRTVAPEGFTPFAVALAVGFLATYTIELVRFAGLHRYARPRSNTGVGGR